MRKNNFITAVIIGLLILISLAYVYSLPTGPEITYNATVNATPNPAADITTAGGTFTTLILNATMQNYRWKAYVGNVTGKFVLQDANNYSIYDWALTTVAGEVYVSRNDSISWTQVNCSNQTIIGNEEYALNITDSKVDSINRTFNTSIHKTFYVGNIYIRNSTCPAIATYLNGTPQTRNESAAFQEVLLTDRTNLIYSTLLENKIQGFNNQLYDFQLIVPDYGSEAITTSVPYYFFIELS